MTGQKSLYNRTGNYFIAFYLTLLAGFLFPATGCLAANELCSPSAAPPDTPFKMPTISAPAFPDRTIDIRDYGAVGDGNAMNTKAIAYAVAACAKAGGGRVLIPEGVWLTGPIHLKSNINLHIDKGAEVRFSTRFEDYLPVVFTRWEGTECYNYSSLIYAVDCNNIAITGTGTLEGQGQAWWHMGKLQVAGGKRLYDAACKAVPVKDRIFGTEKDALRPPTIQLVNCKNVLLKDYTSRNSPFWNNHLIYCENVIARNLTLLNPEDAPNSDGINLDSCRYVYIEDIYADVGDDAVTIKAGLNEDGWRVNRPTENIVIRNCMVKKGHGGFVIGSEMSGSVRNILVQDCNYDGTNIGVRIKSMRGRGGVVENILIRNIAMRQIKKDAIRLDMFYMTATVKPITDTPPEFRDMQFKNITCNQADAAIVIHGLAEKSIKNITFEDVVISAEKGIDISDGEHIKLTNVNITPKQDPVMLLTDSRDITIQNSSCTAAVGTFLRLEGEKTKNIRLKGNDFSKAQKGIVFGEKVNPDAVIREK